MGKSIMANESIFHNKYSQYPATAIRARQLGEMYFFTGKPCKRGHVSLKYSSSGNCALCISEKRGKVAFNHKGGSSKRSPENQLLADEAHGNGFTRYQSLTKCPQGHTVRFVTNNNCVACSNATANKRKEKARWARIYKEYGITQTDFNKMLQQQDNKCSICSCDINQQNTHIDHCHNRNIVRSLLCNRCNQAIGLLDENIHNFESAIKYLQRHLNEIATIPTRINHPNI